MNLATLIMLSGVLGGKPPTPESSLALVKAGIDVNGADISPEAITLAAAGKLYRAFWCMYGSRLDIQPNASPCLVAGTDELRYITLPTNFYRHDKLANIPRVGLDAIIAFDCTELCKDLLLPQFITSGTTVTFYSPSDSEDGWFIYSKRELHQMDLIKVLRGYGFKVTQLLDEQLPHIWKTTWGISV